MRRALAVVVVVCAVFGLGSTAAGAKDQNNLGGAEKAFLRFAAQTVDRQWGPMYGYLHPAQRAAVDKASFMACKDKAVREGVGIKDVTFKDHYRETVTIPGTDVKAKSTALTVEYTATLGDIEKTMTDTVHLFYVGGRWRVTMDADGFAKCTASRSPTKQASSALELGTSVDFGGWKIGIMKVTRDDGIVPYKPEPGIKYAGFRVELTGTYAGKGDSSIDIDFKMNYVGTDGRVYADFDSHEGDEPLVSGPNVVAGGTQTIEFPLAVPTSALGGDLIHLESWTSSDKGPSWSAGI